MYQRVGKKKKNGGGGTFIVITPNRTGSGRGEENAERLKIEAYIN